MNRARSRISHTSDEPDNSGTCRSPAGPPDGSMLTTSCAEAPSVCGREEAPTGTVLSQYCPDDSALVPLCGGGGQRWGSFLTLTTTDCWGKDPREAIELNRAFRVNGAEERLSRIRREIRAAELQALDTEVDVTLDTLSKKRRQRLGNILEQRLAAGVPLSVIALIRHRCRRRPIRVGLRRAHLGSCCQPRPGEPPDRRWNPSFGLASRCWRGSQSLWSPGRRVCS
jgi:hypothetical protein